MNKNQQLYQWLKAKSKRGSELARQMGVTKQYISEVSHKGTGISDRKWAEFQDAMACVEKMEGGV